MNRVLKKGLLLLTSVMMLVCLAFAFTVVSAADSAASISMVEGAAVRIATDGNNGLRFKATVGNSDDDAEYHIVIVPADYLANYESGDKVDYLNEYIAALNAEKGTNIKLNDQICSPYYDEDEQATCVRASITKVLYQNAAREFTAFAYSVKDGVKTYTQTDSTRSLASVAVKALAAGQTEQVLKDYVTRGMKRTLELEESAELPVLTVNPAKSAIFMATDSDGISREISYDVYNAATKEKVSELNDFVYVLSNNENVSYYDGKVVIGEGITEDIAATLTFYALGGEGTTTGKFAVSVTAGFENYNLFAQQFASGNNAWIPQAGANIKREWNSELNGITVTRVVDNTVNAAQFTSNNNRIYLGDLAVLKEALAKGYEKLTFEYNSTLTATTDYYGFAIWRNTVSTAVGNEYKRVAGSDLVNGEWTTVTVNLNDLFDSANANADYLSIVVCGAPDTTITFRNAKFEKKDLEKDNIFSEAYFDKWAVVNASATKVELENGVFSFVGKLQGAGLDQRNYACYAAIDYLKEAKELGYKIISFKVTGNDDFASFANKGTRVYSKLNAGQDVGAIKDGTTGVKVYKDFGTEAGEKEFIVTIDIDEFLALDTNAKYIAFVINVPKDCKLTISEFALKKN